MASIEILNERLEAAGFLAKESGSAYEPLQLSTGEGADTLDIQFTRLAQAVQRLFHVVPRGILGQVRSGHDFKSGLCRPPVLRAVIGAQHLIKVADFLDRYRHGVLLRAANAKQTRLRASAVRAKY